MPDKKVEVQDKDKNPSLEDSTQQTNNQVDPPTDDKVEPIDPNYVASLEQRIADQQIANRKFEQMIEALKENRDQNNNQPPPPRNVEKERNDFYADPIGRLNEQLSARDDKILKQMEQMLAPIKDVASTFRTNNEYDRMKAIVKNDPIYGKGLKDPDVEATVDAIMKSGVEITEDNIKSAVAQTMGVKAMGGFRGNNGNRTTTTTTQDRIDPPNVPTTRTRSNMPDAPKELNEDDRLAMKFAQLNPNNPEHVKQYWELISDDKMTLSVHKKGEAK